MENNGNRPQRIDPDQVDGAVDEALERVEQAKELSIDELDAANGGVSIQPTTSGFLTSE